MLSGPVQCAFLAPWLFQSCDYCSSTRTNESGDQLPSLVDSFFLLGYSILIIFLPMWVTSYVAQLSILWSFPYCVFLGYLLSSAILGHFQLVFTYRAIPRINIESCFFHQLFTRTPHHSLSIRVNCLWGHNLGEVTFFSKIILNFKPLMSAHCQYSQLLGECHSLLNGDLVAKIFATREVNFPEWKIYQVLQGDRYLQALCPSTQNSRDQQRISILKF